MRKIVDFVVIFDDGVRKRHYHETEKGGVTYFSVQLEIEVKGEWKVAVRYDCSHGFSHKDKYDIKGNQQKEEVMNKYTEFLTMVSTEFHRYLMENEQFADKIPANALIIFRIEGEEGFNNWHKVTSLKNRETNQPVIYICVKKWRKHSSIEEVSMAGIT